MSREITINEIPVVINNLVAKKSSFAFGINPTTKMNRPDNKKEDPRNQLRAE